MPMQRIKPVQTLLDRNGSLVVIDDKGRVWVLNDQVNPSRWVEMTQLPEVETPQPKATEI